MIHPNYKRSKNESLHIYRDEPAYPEALVTQTMWDYVV